MVLAQVVLEILRKTVGGAIMAPPILIRVKTVYLVAILIFVFLVEILQFSQIKHISSEKLLGNQVITM